MTGELLDAAFAYAGFGRRVFPLHSPVDGPDGLICDCAKGTACESPAKHPRTANGLTDATADADGIRRWWRMWPTANIGLPMGDGLVAVDVDPRPAGEFAAPRSSRPAWRPGRKLRFCPNCSHKAANRDFAVVRERHPEEATR